MKRNTLLAIFLMISAFMLIGCEEDAETAGSTLTAKAEDFKTHFYESDRYTIYLHENGLTIYGTFIGDDRKSVLDEVVVSDDMDSPFVHKEFANAKVEVNGDKYLVTAEDGISLKFTKFMEHIIVDSEGMEYIRKAK